MKNFKNSIAFLAIIAFFFTSCSKDEAIDNQALDSQDTYQLQFGVLLNDFNKVQQQTKDHEAPPVECREDDPAYVKVGIKKADGFFVGDNNNDNVKDVVLIEVDIKDNNGSWETVFSDDLGLPAGEYSLEYFIVYDASDEILWVAPRKGGAYASSVDDPLAQPIVLGPGTKPYINVDVLCFIPRDEEAFGYLFFDFELERVVNNYCIFVNFCDDGTGREYPAKFMVDVWKNSKIPANKISLNPNMNSVSGSGNDFAATVLCMPLPPLDGQDVYIVRVTVVDAGAYDADASDFKEFTITQGDINAQLNEMPRYEHIRINCEDDGGNGECDPQDADADCDNDGVPNGDDECKGEGVRGNVDEVGCPIIDPCDQTHPNYNTFDCDGDTILNGVDNCPNRANPGQDPDQDCDGILDVNEAEGCVNNPDPNCGPTSNPCNVNNDFGAIPGDECGFVYGNGETDFFEVTNNFPQYLAAENGEGPGIGVLNVMIDGGDVLVSADLDGIEDLILKYEIVVSKNADGSECKSVYVERTGEEVTDNWTAESLGFTDASFPIYVRVKVLVCLANPTP